MHPAVAVQYLRCLLESAHVLVIQKKITEALPLLNWAETLPRDYDRALSCTKYAEILVGMQEADRAEAYCRKVKEASNKHLSEQRKSGASIGQGSSNLDVSSVWAELRYRVGLVEAEVQSQRATLQFGKEYGLYVMMRLYADMKHYSKASEIAKQIIQEFPQSVFSAAAGYSYGVYLLQDQSEPNEVKRIQNMIQWMQRFVAEDPDGLYRGEALLLVGKVAMEKLWDAKHAMEYYQRALAYFVKARENANALSLYAPISGDLQSYAQPKGKLTTYNQWYRVVRHDQAPLKLYNTSSSPPWYRNEQEKACHLAIGFLLFNDEKYDEAKEHWSKILSLDEGMQAMPSHLPNVRTRLLGACDQKFITFSQDEKKKIQNPRMRLKILYAEYLYFLERFEEAIEIYQDILANSDSPAEKAVATTAIGLAIDTGVLTGGGIESKKSAEKRYKWVLDQDENACGVAMYANNMLNYAGSLLGTQYGKAESIQMYRKLLYVNKYEKTLRPEQKANAIFGLIQSLFYLKKYEEAKSEFDKYYKSNEKDEVFYKILVGDFRRLTETGSPWKSSRNKEKVVSDD